jgi:glycosyltransferase involved in cell wall biosynthesis
MKVLFSHPTGNAFVRAAALGMAEAGILGEFHTGIATFPGSLFHRLGDFSPMSELKKRRFVPILKDFTYTHPLYELLRLFSQKAGINFLSMHEQGMFSVDKIYHRMDKKVSSRFRHWSSHNLTAVYAYEDGALESFKTARILGMKSFYDLPIGYWRTARRLLEFEKERWPEYAMTLNGLTDSNEKLDRKDQELAFAGHIYVASQFTAETLKDYPGQLPTVEIIPYGFPDTILGRDYIKAGNRKLKMLFVGSLSQRKGVADLFAAVKAFPKEVQLTIVGRKPLAECMALDAELKKHHWISSLPHDEILQLMREHDVLIFPSLFEGFGLVITEAMSQGTPVITTDRTAGPAIIENGRNGWLIPAASTNALKAAIENLLNNPDLIPNAGIKAMESAAKRPWSVYGRELANSLKIKL